MSYLDVHANAESILSRWSPPTNDQSSLRYAYLTHLRSDRHAVERSCAAGHLTASTLLCDSTGRRTLLTLHPRVGRWLQLGGHCEPSDTSLVEAALREATEESGIEELQIDPIPLRLHVHPLTCSGGVPTHHLDVQFLATAPAGSRAVMSAESLDLKWFDFDALPDDADDAVRALVTEADRRLKRIA
ncbi:MAG: NUDIX domain-containing protein [Antricoccus sp.]